MARNLLTAILRSASGAISIDAEAGVIRGVKLMELGKLARFAGEEGPKQVKISDAHIQALLNHAGNKAIPIHETHDWFEAGTDTAEMSARIGSAKNFRRNDAGDLIADAYLNKAKPAALDLLWGAENNPEDNCFSVVFSYLKDDPNCIPQNFRAADLVPNGAATTALFSDDSTQKTMDISELIAALADPKVQAAVKAIMKSHNDDAAADEAASGVAAAEMESDAGVTDADKKEGDDQKPALMRAALRCGRAFARKAKALDGERTALLAEVDTKIAASATALIGNTQFKRGTEQHDENASAKWSAALKELTDKGATLATATMTCMQTHKDVYNEMNVALFKPAKQL